MLTHGLAAKSEQLSHQYQTTIYLYKLRLALVNTILFSLQQALFLMKKSIVMATYRTENTTYRKPISLFLNKKAVYRLRCSKVTINSHIRLVNQIIRKHEGS